MHALNKGNLIISCYRRYIGRADSTGEVAVSLRLGKMLVKQHVDFQHYLFSQSEAGLLRQIRNCMRCRNLAECDAYLATRHTADTGDFRFCPNHDLITGLRKLQPWQADSRQTGR